MPTTWEDVALEVESQLKSAIDYAQITVISSNADYILGNVGQSLNRRDYLVLLSKPDEKHYFTEPMLSGYFRRHYMVDIILVVKTDPTSLGRTFGNARKGLSEFQAEIEAVLEHSNLGTRFDNKAGQNFVEGWSLIPVEGKAFSASRTIYTVVKTER